MAHDQPARALAIRTGWAALVVIVLTGSALAGVLVHQSPVASSSGIAAEWAPSAPPSSATASTPRRHALGTPDGLIPDGTTVFSSTPGVAKLDAALLAALRRAATAAANQGVQILVTSGWRSHAYQEQLFREAVARYGSTEEAAQWVATPGESSHETGAAVDLAPSEAIAWLSGHGAAYGLCQVYRNEPWHYELRPDAVSQGCPPMYPDPSHDSRMHP